MSKFIKHIGIFTFTTVVLIFFSVFTSGHLAKQTFDFKISSKKNILVLGNSHPEHSLNDHILFNVFNLAQSGSGYFYDYLKLREVTKHNTQIDTLVIGYAYDDLHKQMDSWFDSPERIKHKFRNFFFLFNLNDYLSVFKANPKNVLLSTPQVIFQNLLRKPIGYKGLGGYLKTDVHKLEVAKKNNGKYYRNIGEGISKYQSKYLVKIYEYCKKHNIKLILLNTPIHPDLQQIQEPLKSQYCSFAKNSLPDALLLNHSKFIIPDKGYRDLDHLNSIGAELYSSYLVTNKFELEKKACYFYQ